MIISTRLFKVLFVMVVEHVVEEVLVFQLLEESLNDFENAFIELLYLHFVRAFLVVELGRPHCVVGGPYGWPTHNDAALGVGVD